MTVSWGVTVKSITQMLNVTVCVFPPPTAVIVATYRPVPAVERVMVAMSGSVAVPAAASATVGLRVKGRLELPAVETKAKLIVAVTLSVAAKLLMLAMLSVVAAVTNGPLLNTVIVSGTALNEKSGTPTLTATGVDFEIVPLVPVTVTV
jgi:hypothetical protein